MQPLQRWGMGSRIVSLMIGSVVLVTGGALADWMWLIGIGAWMLIAAGPLEMIYRPSLPQPRPPPQMWTFSTRRWSGPARMCPRWVRTRREDRSCRPDC